MQERKSLIPDGTVIPVPEHRRVSTDVCCTIISSIFALTLFIIACVFYSSAGVHSAYFAFQNSNTAANQILSNDYYGFLTAFWALIVTALGLGLLWMTLVHFLPRISPHIAHVAASLVLIALGIIVLVCWSAYYNSHNGWKIAVAVIAFILAIIIFCMFCFYSAQLRLQGIFLEYARRFLHDWMAVYAYIPLFMFFLAGLIALFMFQHLAFSSKGVSNSDLWDFSNPGVLGVLNIIEFIWAFQFLRDAFNFCVAGSATDWYWNTYQTKCSTSLARLVTRHWGSVVAGSFLNGFFQVPTLIVELFTCHPGTCCNKLGVCCEQKCCCGFFFNLVRTDAYSYINLAGEPFCNSARECYDVCIHASDQFVGGFNPMKHYRFVASTFLTALLYILGSIYVNKRVVNFYWWQNVVLIVISYAVICWFVDISADAAEGISTSFLTENSINGYEEMRYAQPQYMTEIRERSNRQGDLRDGNI